MRASILVLSFFITLAIQAQDAPLSSRHTLKLYNLITWERNQVDRPYANPAHQREVDRLRLLQPTIAYNWLCGNGHAQEIELTNLSLQRSTTHTSIVNDTTGAVLQVLDGLRTIETHIALRYEYIMDLNRAGASRWTPAIGAAISPYFRQYDALPLVSIDFPTSEQRYGAMFFVVPRISCRISDRVHFDLNVPLNISEGYFIKERQQDPNLPAEQQTITSLNFRSFPAFYSLRAGIGVEL